MTRSTSFAHDATRSVDRLAEHLTAADPDETQRILGAVLDAEDGVLSRVVTLLSTASYRARHHGDSRAHLYGQMANDLHDLVLDFDAALNPAPVTAAASPARSSVPAPARRSR